MMNEQQLRRELNKQGYTLHKSRRRSEPSPEEYTNFVGDGKADMGGYQITDNTGAIIEGHDYELTLEDVEGWAKEFLSIQQEGE